MKCGHCGEGFHLEGNIVWSTIRHKNSLYHSQTFYGEICPECNEFNLILATRKTPSKNKATYNTADKVVVVYPNITNSVEIPECIPDAIAQDYREAYLIKDLSPKASAALSRRCLQSLLINAENIEQGKSLKAQIDLIKQKGNLPSRYTQMLDLIRHTGNLAAHPMTSNSTGEIVDIEPGEAEINLEILASLFDFYYVQPERRKKQVKNINKKLKDVGRKESIELDEES